MDVWCGYAQSMWFDFYLRLPCTCDKEDSKEFMSVSLLTPSPPAVSEGGWWCNSGNITPQRGWPPLRTLTTPWSCHVWILGHQNLWTSGNVSTVGLVCLAVVHQSMCWRLAIILPLKTRVLYIYSLIPRHLKNWREHLVHTVRACAESPWKPAYYPLH